MMRRLVTTFERRADGLLKASRPGVGFIFDQCEDPTSETAWKATEARAKAELDAIQRHVDKRGVRR